MTTPEIGAKLSFNGLSALYRIARILGTGEASTAVMLNVLEILES